MNAQTTTSVYMYPAVAMAGLIACTLFLGMVPYTAYAQEAAFGYSVSGYQVTVSALSPQDGNAYWWAFAKECQSNATFNCYQHTGQEVSVNVLNNNYVQQGDVEVDVTLDIYNQDQDRIGSETKTIPVGPGQSYTDTDGDGSTNVSDDDDDGDGVPDSEDPCPKDPDDNCDNNQNDSDGDGMPDDEDSCPNDPANECDQANTNDGQSGGLVNCGRAEPGEEISNWCDYEDLINLINRLITWLIGILTLVGTLLFMYAGFLYLTAAGDTNQTEQATKIFQHVALGFGIVLLAWLLITSIVGLLTREDWQKNWKRAIPVNISVEEINTNSLS